MGSVTALSHLLRPDGELRAAYTDQEPVHLTGAVELDDLPDVDYVHRLIDCSLLRKPYFAVFHDGITPPGSELVSRRRVGGRSVDGFIDGAKIRAKLAAGATLKLNQAEHWNPVIKVLVDELSSAFPAAVKAFFFYTPADKRGLLPHRDGARALVVQISGAKRWQLYDSPIEARSEVGVCAVTGDSRTLVLRPGDLLFLPHGYAHAAEAVDGDSLHLTFTLTEPSPGAFAQAYLEQWVSNHGDAIRLLDGESSSPTDMGKVLLSNLVEFGNTVDSAALVERAVQIESARMP